MTREFYYNDAGVQIANLGRSVQARARQARGEDAPFPEDGYHGDYIAEIAADFLAAGGDAADLDAATRFAVKALRAEQDTDLQALGVRFDNYYLESSLYTDGRVDKTVKALVASGHTYEGEGALWLKTTDYGDDKDRVMRKSDGTYTYFVPDVAYHVTKWERGFVRAINIQGSDHHSTVVRVRAGLQSLGLGIPAGYPDYVLHKMVRVMRGGEEVKISKRAGSYVTVRDLIDDVGRDAVRFFLASRKADTEFTFDLDLAKSQSEDNPVYYVQYAHARVCSVLAAWGEKFGDEARTVDLTRRNARPAHRRPRDRSHAAPRRLRRRARAGGRGIRPASGGVLPARTGRGLPQLLQCRAIPHRGSRHPAGAPRAGRRGAAGARERTGAPRGERTRVDVTPPGP